MKKRYGTFRAARQPEMNLNLYKAILTKRPDNEQGMKAPSLEVISFILTTVVISALTIWAVWCYVS